MDEHYPTDKKENTSGRINKLQVSDPLTNRDVGNNFVSFWLTTISQFNVISSKQEICQDDAYEANEIQMFYVKRPA